MTTPLWQAFLDALRAVDSPAFREAALARAAERARELTGATS